MSRATPSSKDLSLEASIASKMEVRPPDGKTDAVIGPDAPEFFLVCTPGLEDLTEAELDVWAAGYERRRERGGVTLFAPLEVGYGLNRILKTPTRILVRIARFGCRDFPKLFKRISGFAWEEWVPDSAVLDFEAAAHSSRLKIKKRIEETCLDGRKARLKKRAVGAQVAGPKLDVLIRFDEDVATMSLDTSGEILHKRGSRALAAEAPLRETTAAALLLRLASLAPLTEAPIELIDPMTGGGTFLLEAAQLNLPTRGREYAYEKFSSRPVPNQTMAAQTEAPEKSADCAKAVSAPRAHVKFAKLIGYDLEAKALDSARGNLKNIHEELDLRHEDFFAAEPLAETSSERWFIVNPPYGERLKVEGKLGDFYEKLMAAAERVAHPTRACFLFPVKAQPDRLKQPTGWKRMESRKFSNGGLPVVALFFVRREGKK